MAYTQGDLDAIKKIKASGMLRGMLPSVGSVEYRSVAELDKIQNEIQAELNTATGGRKPVRRVKVFAIKDL